MESWCNVTVDEDFLRCMKDVLAVYARPLDPRRVEVCFDEKSVQLLADSRPSQPVRPGHARRVDYEYVRHGVANLFMFLMPKLGLRHVLVTQRRTKLDFAYAMRYLTQHVVPGETMIDLITDQLNTHRADNVIEIFGMPHAQPIVSRLTFHYTPVHASWLNLAESELSALTRQCLDRRIPDAWMLATEIIAWERPRNEVAMPMRWSLDWKRAKRMFDPLGEFCPLSDTMQD